MEEKNKNNQNNKKWTIILIISICVLAIVTYMIVKKINDKSYKLEEVTDFSYFKLYEDEKYGVIDKSGNVVVPAVYDSMDIPNPSKAVFIGTNDKESDVINEKNEKILTGYSNVTALIFKDALSNVPYEKSVLSYEENGKYGIVDFNGKKITKAVYDSIESIQYKEGCLLVKQNDKYGVITIKGKQIAKTIYDSIAADGYYDEETQYKNAGFIVGTKQKNGYRYGYINNNGKIILKTEYNKVERITDISASEGTYIIAFKNGQAGVYKGKKLFISHSYEDIEYNNKSELFIIQKNGKQGVRDKDGNVVLNIDYEDIIIYQDYISATKNAITYFFNKQGERINTDILETTITTGNNYYVITLNQDSKYGIKRKDGNIVIPNQYTYIEYAYNNYFILTKDGKVSVYDVTKDKEIISDYSIIQKIEGKNALQAIAENQYETIEIYNKNMEKTATMKETTLTVYDNYIKLCSENERKYFDNDGNEITYDKIFPNLKFYAFKENDKWGFKDKEGNVKIEPTYDMVTELNDYGFAGTKKDGKWGVVNSDGTVIVDPTYEIKWDEPEFIGRYCKFNFGYGMIYYTKDFEQDF